MAVERRKCSTCGNGFLGTPRAQFCSSTCRQRSHRRRSGKKRDERDVTQQAAAAGRTHTVEAQAVLAALDAELAENTAQLSLDEPLEWTAVERTVLELIADTIDRRVDLQQRYERCDDDALRLKLATEVRLLETSLDRLLTRIRTDLPVAPSRRSQKAAQAAQSRWGRDGA